MDDRNTTTTAPSIRHRLDSASAARSPGAGDYRNRASVDGPRGDSGMAAQEMTKRADIGDGRVDPKVERMDFGEALGVLRRGGRVAREGWNGRGQFIAFAFGSMFSGPGINGHQDGHTCIVIQPTSGPLVPWVASQTDLMAHDWCLVREVPQLIYGHGHEQADGERSGR